MVERLVDLLARGIAVDWNGSGVMVAPRGALLRRIEEGRRAGEWRDGVPGPVVSGR